MKGAGCIGTDGQQCLNLILSTTRRSHKTLVSERSYSVTCLASDPDLIAQYLYKFESGRHGNGSYEGTVVKAYHISLLCISCISMTNACFEIDDTSFYALPKS